MSEDSKKRKAVDCLGEARQVASAGTPSTSTTTGAHSKFMDLACQIKAKNDDIEAKTSDIEAKKSDIEAKESEIEAKEREVVAKKIEIDRAVATLDEKTKLLEIIQLQNEQTRLQYEIIQLHNEKDQLQYEKDQLQNEQTRLRNEKDQLQYEKDQLQYEKDQLQYEIIQLHNEKDQLYDSYSLGKYYAATSDVWVVQSIEYQVKLDDWMQFVRDHRNPTFSCRHSTETRISIGLGKNDPYGNTRKGALDRKCTAPNSITSKNASSTQSQKSVRDAIWPRDIFGREDPDAEIAHLLPAGPTHWKEWTYVAAAVVMLPKGASIAAKKKATIGYKKEAKKRKEGGTGVVHFVSNKIRLSNQKNLWDGNNNKCLLVPVMTLEEAKNWRGEGYKAVFLIGHPHQASQDFDGSTTIPATYQGCKLAGAELLHQKSSTRDATPAELISACAFLEKAVLGLGAMVASLSDDDIYQLRNNKAGDSDKGKEYATNRYNEMKDTRKQAQNAKTWKVPMMRSQAGGKKPACLVRFGSHDENDCHPAPDPLLLVMKSANVWARMTCFKLIANGAVEDDNFSERDYMEMEAFIEERERSFRASTWEELAIGLGQPTGYCEVSGA